MQTTRWGAPLAATAIFLAFTTVGAFASFDFMPVGKRSPQPIGHYEFCRRTPEECRSTTGQSRPVAMTRELWSRLVEVNDSVNLTVIPRTDMELWGVAEYWSYPNIYGDCEDYVMEKRRRLIEVGVPAGNLLITVVRQPNGDGHAVLTVSTSMGEFVLDNLKSRILIWSETEYEYLKRQSSENPAHWISINDGRSPTVVSVTPVH